MVERSDAQLVMLSCAGDRAAFEELARRHERRLLATALHLVGDREAARDLTQEALVSAFTGIKRLRAHGQFRGWVYGILLNLCRKHLRRRQPKTVALDLEAIPANSPPPNDGPGDLAEALHALPREAREILSARYLNDMTYAEIAEQMRLSVGNVRVKCFRARQALRELLAQRGDPRVAIGGEPA